MIPGFGLNVSGSVEFAYDFVLRVRSLPQSYRVGKFADDTMSLKMFEAIVSFGWPASV